MEKDQQNVVEKLSVADAIISLRPGAQFICRDDDVEWLDEVQTMPEPWEIEEERIRLYQVYLNNEYQRNRMIAYPSIQDQLDTLYHQGYDGWRSMIDEVKSKYPKPQ